ncbi:MAG TPA: tetratricopeptide repeat protein, partial [Pyrinomonadaceae bacterium]|nr:tetratricopeptide repeat protein [Pyrinomonadaceae bacterium]
MKLPDEEKKLREYVLGEIGDEDRSALEDRLMTDVDYFQKLSIAEEDLIQDYADGNLDAAERAKFEKRFLISEENRQKVKFARALGRYVNENDYSPDPQKKLNFFDPVKAFFSMPVIASLGVLIVLGAVGFFVWQTLSSSDPEILIALNKAYRTERPVESRITGLDYAPMKNTRGANDSDKTGKIERNLARELALSAAAENPSAENLHNLGRVYLAEKNFADAVKYLERAVRLAPNEAQLRSDYGAALLEEAKTLEEGKLETLAKAIEEFAKAIELDKNLLDAYFNQALAIQASSYLPNQAREAWQKYLELDSSSKWAEEARRNLETLETNKPISKTKEEVLQEFLEAGQTGSHEKAWQTLSRNREIITGKLIPQQLAFLFVDAKTEGDQIKSKEYLEALIYAGKLEEENSGDLYWKDIAEFYSTVSDDKIPLLKQAHDSMKRGYIFSKEVLYEKAKKEFENARRIFSVVGNAQEDKFCEYWLGYVFNRLKNTSKSVELLKSVESFSESNNYKWLSGHTLCWLAINESESGKVSKALEYYEKALAHTESVSDTYNTQKILSLIASEYKSLKRNDVALKYLEKSLELEKLPEASQRQKWRDYEAITKTLYTFRYYRTALAFGHELLNLAFINEDNSFKCDSYLTLGAIYGSLKNYPEAISLTEKGLETAKLLNSDDEKAVESANANLYLGHLEKQAGNYDKALIHYDRAAGFYESSNYQGNKYEARKGKLFCYLATNDEQAFQNELPKVLELFENNRAEILEEQNRNSFFESEQSVYDIAIDYEFGRENFGTAFDYSEESRARSLLDMQTSTIEITKKENQPEIKFSRNIFDPLKLAQIQAELPENVQLLEYTVLNDKILIWLITKNNLYVARTEISSENLQEKALTYLDLISRNI